MNLLELQRRFSEALMTPLNCEEKIAEQTVRGESMQQVAESLVKPNDRLSSTERLEIYSRSYWFRLISSFNEDFVGLRAIIGDEKFDVLVQAYLSANPSRSFTLRDLGSRLEQWLSANPQYIYPHEQLALDMVRLEWADTECFDAAEELALTLDDIGRLGEDPKLRLQPHIRLLDLQYPVDKLLLAIRAADEDESDEASNTFSERRSRAHLKRVRKSKPQPVFLVVHRVDNLVYFKRVTPEAGRILAAFRNGMSLSEAIDAAFNPSTVPQAKMLELVQGWFRDWAQWRWFSKEA
ncbi:MAG TPA: DNA-binding domain-containing protein [Terriglobales bacterium]|nr:DNA-binding domain-containing protein [Terriglobales bacterium]